MTRRNFLKAVPLLPYSARAWVVPVVCGVIVIGTGAYVVWQIYKLCQKIDQKPDKDPGPPPPCDCGNPKCTCNQQPAPSQAVKLPDDGVAYYDVSGLGYTDPVTGSPVRAYFTATLLSSTDLKGWAQECAIQGWASVDGTMVAVTKAGIVMKAYMPMGGTCQVPVDIGSGKEPQKFFKVI